MTATEQWIFLCAAHKNPQEVGRESHLSQAEWTCIVIVHVSMCSACYSVTSQTSAVASVSLTPQPLPSVLVLLRNRGTTEGRGWLARLSINAMQNVHRCEHVMSPPHPLPTLLTPLLTAPPVLGNRLHAAHPPRGRLPPQQQQVLPQPHHHQGDLHPST